MLISIIELDHQAFHFINQAIANPVFDVILPALRSKTFWIPLYIFIIAFLFFNFKYRAAALYLILLISTVIISDFTSSQLIKKTVKRVRPCNQVELQHQVRTLVHCGGGFSFTSSHATNHFALATFLILTLGRLFRRIRPILFIWALSISFAQVYVGVHFPLDILFGGILGIVIGSLVAEIYNRWLPHKIYPPPEVT